MTQWKTFLILRLSYGKSRHLATSNMDAEVAVPPGTAQRSKHRHTDDGDCAANAITKYLREQEVVEGDDAAAFPEVLDKKETSDIMALYEMAARKACVGNKESFNKL